MHHGLDLAAASAYARVGLENVAREYPNHPGHLLTGREDLQEPHILHPVFYGSYDWHSSVHQHWMLLRLLHRFPDLPEGPAIRAWFDTHLGQDPRPVAAEAAYLDHPARRTFERPYGWAWLLLLAAELTARAQDPQVSTGDRAAATRWAATLSPLTRRVAERMHTWLATTTYPNRVGTHPSSAFACSLLLDALDRVAPAVTMLDTPPSASATPTQDAGNTWGVGSPHELRAVAVDAARRWYLDDRAAPTRYEPSAADFLSPTLVEAELMSRVLAEPERIAWLEGFLTDPDPLLRPATVTDRTDPHTVHLDGLNLSRAWSWLRIGAALPAGHALQPVARAAADTHREASLPHILDDYVGSHWLPTFAVHLDDVEVATRDVHDPDPSG